MDHSENVGVPPVRLRARTRGERRLIRSVIHELAGQRDDEPFGRIVRAVHITAATTLPAGATGDVEKQRLQSRCQQRLQTAQRAWPRAVA